jgi:hypothetical protein
MMRAPTEELFDMHGMQLLMIVLAVALLDAGAASGQTVLRIGLNDDPDVLDATISRAARRPRPEASLTYVLNQRGRS